MTDLRRYDPALALAVLSWLYAAACLALTASVGLTAGAQAGVLALLLSLIVGLLVAGLTGLVTMAVLDIRRAGGPR